MVGGSVSKWSVVGWSVVGESVVGGFNKTRLFVRSRNYTQVCDHDFHRTGKVS